MRLGKKPEFYPDSKNNQKTEANTESRFWKWNYHKGFVTLKYLKGFKRKRVQK